LFLLLFMYKNYRYRVQRQKLSHDPFCRSNDRFQQFVKMHFKQNARFSYGRLNRITRLVETLLLRFTESVCDQLNAAEPMRILSKLRLCCMFICWEVCYSILSILYALDLRAWSFCQVLVSPSLQGWAPIAHIADWLI